MATKDPFQVHVRLPEELSDRVDKHVERLCRETPGIEFSRTDAVLTLIARGLEVVEKPSRAKNV